MTLLSRILVAGVLCNSFLGGGGDGGGSGPAPAPSPTPAPAPAPDPANPNPTPPPANQPPAYTSPYREGLNDDGTFKEGWTQKLEKDFPRLANRLMEFKDERSAFASLDSALGLIGKKAPEIGPPKAGASDEAIKAYRDAVGIPGDAGGYGLAEALKGVAGFTADDAQLGAYQDLFHANHVPKEVAVALATKFAENAVAQTAGALDGFEKKIESMTAEADKTFRAEWGTEYENRLNANKDYIQTLGLDMEDPGVRLALSIPAVVKAFDVQRRELRGEAQLDGKLQNSNSGTMSPRQQAQQIMRENPNYRSDPTLYQRVIDLQNLQAQQDKRSKK